MTKLRERVRRVLLIPGALAGGSAGKMSCSGGVVAGLIFGAIRVVVEDSLNFALL